MLQGRCRVGILDSIIGTNTSAGTQAAVGYGLAGLNQANANGQQDLSSTTAQGNDALTTGATSALGAISQGYGGAADAVSGYGAQAQRQLGQGINRAAATSGAGASAFQPYAQGGATDSALYNDAIGAGGPAGTAAAQAAFTASPGYQYQLDQSTQNAERSAAALGLAGSGNTLQAITSLGSNLANQEYQNFTSNLNAGANRGVAAASGVAGADQAAGSLLGTGATTGATLQQGTGTNLGNLGAAGGAAAAGVDTGLGAGLSANDTALGLNQSNLGVQIAQDDANLLLTGGKASDTAANTNNSLFGKLISGVASLPLGGGTGGTGGTGGGTSLGGSVLSKLLF